METLFAGMFIIGAEYAGCMGGCIGGGSGCCIVCGMGCCGGGVKAFPPGVLWSAGLEAGALVHFVNALGSKGVWALLTEACPSGAGGVAGVAGCVMGGVFMTGT